MSIYDCMDEFCKEEKLDDKNMYHCESCNQRVRATKKIQLWSNPIVLVIQLKRFIRMMRSTKDSRFVHFPITDLDISRMIADENKNDSKCYKYDLYSVINHVGSIDGGHYYSYCKDEDTDQWFKCNDEEVSALSNTVSNERNSIVTPSAYLLFYIRQDMLTKNTEQ